MTERPKVLLRIIEGQVQLDCGDHHARISITQHSLFGGTEVDFVDLDRAVTFIKRKLLDQIHQDRREPS